MILQKPGVGSDLSGLTRTWLLHGVAVVAASAAAAIAVLPASLRGKSAIVGLDILDGALVLPRRLRLGRRLEVRA